MAKSIIEGLSKLLDGIKDELTSMEEKEEETLKLKVQLTGILKLMNKFKKPSEYSPELKKRLDDADIEYSEEEGDHKKNVKLIEDKLADLGDQQAKLQLQTQQAMSNLTKTTEVIAGQLQGINKQQENMMKNLGR